MCHRHSRPRRGRWHQGTHPVNEPRAVAQRSQQSEQLLVRAIERGVERGDFSVPDVPAAVRAISDMGQRISAWYRPGGRLTPDELVSTYLDLALRMLGADAG